MPPRNTIWPLEPHTLGKHKVLENYMQAWLPIMTRWNGRVLFIDAFAGPGEYEHGEPGSPVIALQALISHNAQRRMTSEINYLFIEKKKARSDYLEEVLGELEEKLPPNCNYEVINSTFDETLADTLDFLEEQQAQLAPAFVMIDPFGVSDTPMNTIGRILQNPKSEVFISFMYEWINRFKAEPGFGIHLDDLFGCPDWRRGVSLSEDVERKEFFHNLYANQLKAHGAQFVVPFELYEGERHVYTIFFGTNDLTGCDKMKQAIWKIAPFGDFKFKSGLLNQFTLGESVVDFSLLENSLLERFAGQGWQSIECVENFVKSDATHFHSGHLKRKTLRPMETAGKVEVKEGTRKQAGGFPKGTMLRFVNNSDEGKVIVKQLSF